MKVAAVSNELTCNAEIFPPLYFLLEPQGKKLVLEEFSRAFDMAAKDILVPKESTTAGYQIHFKKQYIGVPETFDTTISHDSIISNSVNFASLDEAIKRHTIIIEIFKKHSDFAAKSLLLTYQANAEVKSGDLTEYLNRYIQNAPDPGKELGNRGVVFVYDGPIENSSIQILVGTSQMLPNALYVSLQYSFSGLKEPLAKVFQICKEFTFERLLPAFEIDFSEGSEVE